MSPNLRAYLDTLAWAEGTSTSKATRCSGYDVIVTGADGKPEVFDSFKDHPFAGGRKSKVINSKGLTSNAAGRYQQMLKDWPHYKALLNLPDFGPASQDAVAIQHIKECRALPLVEAGRIPEAIERCRNIWASLPGAGYGQREHNLTNLLEVFVKSGGRLE